ncbi:MAG: DNA adenine methylase [Bacteroidales bacterium]|nr:DNA adenine methylase [Bacteroidales bacterium]
MALDSRQWREADINVDSLWLIGPRAKGGKHSNFYHGNFAPQVPNQMIRRYTDEGDVLADLFMGSGTALFECESLNRNYIGFDINTEVIDFVNGKMTDSSCIGFFIHNCDITSVAATSLIEQDLTALGKHKLDLIIAHPPYMDIIKFTDRPEDLSAISDKCEFINKFVEAVGRVYSFLKKKKHLVLVIGDVYKNGEVIPLGFYLMYALKKNFKLSLKGIVVKDIVGNRAKIGQEGLWRYRALRNGNFLFKHEYVFVFRKEE